jgi:23S rRNA (pseudouridine1915-N3)-methyltransferase
MKIHLIWEGRTRNEHFKTLQDDYIRRISRFAPVAIEELRSASKLETPDAGKLTLSEERLAEKTRGCFRVLLDPRGEEWTSDEFAEWLGQRALHGTKEIAFVTGGADGFSPAFRQRANLLLSLSRMTLTHDWARTLLLEQIYRAFTILRGHPYPR